MTNKKAKTLSIAFCCGAVVGGLVAFDFACSMWIRPLGIALAGLEAATAGLFIGRSLGEN